MSAAVSFLDRARMRFARALWPRRKQAGGNVSRRSPKEFRLIWPQAIQGEIQWKSINYASFVEEGYERNAVIYAAITYKVMASAAAPLRAWTGTLEDRVRADDDHPLSRLAARPNRSQTGIELQQINEVYLNLAGESFTVIMRDEDNNPIALFPLRPDRVFIAPIPPDQIVYLYAPPASGFTPDKLVPIAEEDMIHVKYPNALDQLEGFGHGFSPITPMAQSADVDNKLTEFLFEFVRRGAVLPGLLTTEQHLDPDTADYIRETWTEKHGGVEQWPEIAVLERGLKYQALTPPFEQMGLEPIDDRNESRIAMVFGVPLILLGTRLGLNRSTFANAESADRFFWQNRMVPELRQFEGEYQERLTTDDAFIAFDMTKVPALIAQNLERVEAFASLFDKGYPRDQAAAIAGIPAPPSPQGDTSFLPSTLIAQGRILPDGTVEELPEPTPAPDEDFDTEADEGEGELESERETRARLIAGMGRGPKPEAPERVIEAMPLKSDYQIWLTGRVKDTILSESRAAIKLRSSIDWNRVIKLLEDTPKLRPADQKFLVVFCHLAWENAWTAEQALARLVIIRGERTVELERGDD